MHEIEAILSHEYFLAVYGVLLYYVILWSIEKDKTDELGKRFDFKKWKSATKDNFIVTLMIVPLIIIFDDEIAGLLNEYLEKDIHFGNMVYLMAGPVTGIIYKLVIKLRK